MRDPEIQHLRHAPLGEHDVQRLQVAVDDALRLGGGRGIGHRVGDGKGLLQGQRSLGQSRRQRLSGDELHGEERLAVDLLERVEGGDVRVIERGEEPGFLAHPLGSVAAARRITGQHLDRNLAAEVGVGR